MDDISEDKQLQGRLAYFDSYVLGVITDDYETNLQSFLLTISE